ncbi:TIGR00730 family Rossman fold protein [Amycolatopsis sp. WQ 127309]|uniref:LOG family protein n=1 Tax=Amycolatopsis sp. WQ 127309 TaxID=2932773 RepID=UPI001FF4F088|nr:TIGR00730 family Rossman fold protein [Amycolatopsis sp. WQ 127309]UOZ06996.1 TIGR00730 family Rossman fold protein [Amycolatopsis sp. WQ 127309]
MTDNWQAVRRIGVFCGARTGGQPQHMETARQFGTALAGRGASVVYGGGAVGLMGAVSGAALAAGALVTGVVPTHLYDSEDAGRSGGETVVVPSMHKRKALMYYLSDAFAVLPGRLGTLDELMEVATWNKLGLHRKPLVLVDPSGFRQTDGVPRRPGRPGVPESAGQVEDPDQRRCRRSARSLAA